MPSPHLRARLCMRKCIPCITIAMDNLPILDTCTQAVAQRFTPHHAMPAGWPMAGAFGCIIRLNPRHVGASGHECQAPRRNHAGGMAHTGFPPFSYHRSHGREAGFRHLVDVPTRWKYLDGTRPHPGRPVVVRQRKIPKRSGQARFSQGSAHVQPRGRRLLPVGSLPSRGSQPPKGAGVAPWFFWNLLEGKNALAAQRLAEAK